MKNSLFDNNWMVGLISLFFALVLFVSVANENNSLASLALNNNSASIDSTVTISNVPVHLGEHDEGTFVSGMPETVSVRLSGPKNIINQISEEDITVQTESLVGKKAGVSSIRFEVIGLPDSIVYKVTPDLFYGTISTKETLTQPVEYEIADGTLAAGFEIDSVELNINEVTLSGSADEINKVARVLIQIFADKPQSTSFTKNYRVQILDKDGNPLDVNPSETEITATVNLREKTKTVGLNIVPVGENESFQYHYTLSNIQTVSISGDNIANIDSLNVIVDVSDLVTSGNVLGVIELIDGISVSPETVDVTVTVNNQQTETNVESNETTVSQPSSAEETTAPVETSPTNEQTTVTEEETTQSNLTNNE